MRNLSLAAVVLTSSSRYTFACVACNSASAHQLRHGIFGPHFLHNLFLIAAPFPIFLALAIAIYLRFPLPASNAAVA